MKEIWCCAVNSTSPPVPVQSAIILRVDVTASLGPASGTCKLNIASALYGRGMRKKTSSGAIKMALSVWFGSSNVV